MTTITKSFILITTTILFLKCKPETKRETEKLQDNLKIYFEANQMDSTARLDSFQLVKIDTITQRMLLFEQSSVLNKQVDNLIDLYKLSNQELSNSVDQMRLYRMLESRDLLTIEKKDFDKKSAKVKLIKFEIDTVMFIVKKIDSTIKHADTIKAIGYQAKCFYQLRLKDKSVKQDTTFIILNSNKDIIKREDFLKLPYKIDFDKLD